MVVGSIYIVFFFFFFKQKTAYEMRISDWSSDVCSSDLGEGWVGMGIPSAPGKFRVPAPKPIPTPVLPLKGRGPKPFKRKRHLGARDGDASLGVPVHSPGCPCALSCFPSVSPSPWPVASASSEEHKSALPSLMRISLAVFYLE